MDYERGRESVRGGGVGKGFSPTVGEGGRRPDQGNRAELALGSLTRERTYA